jgi:hypothetical protein
LGAVEAIRHAVGVAVIGQPRVSTLCRAAYWRTDRSSLMLSPSLSNGQPLASTRAPSVCWHWSMLS